MWHHMINAHTLGVPNAEQQARIDAGETLENMWYGEMQQIPVNMRDNPEGYAQGISLAIPGIRTMRLNFNKNSFGPDGNFHPQMETFLATMTANGWRMLWNLTDGPSQRADEASLQAMYPEAFPPTQSRADMLAYLPHLLARQTEAYNKLMAWLRRNPTVIPHGFECANEPATYSAFGDRYPADLETIMTAYVDHCKAIADICAAGPFPNVWVYVGGWRYSASVPELDSVQLSKYGRSAKAEIVRHIGPRLVWSVHHYPSWISGTRKDAKDFENAIKAKFEWVARDGARVVITEVNSAWTEANNITLSTSIMRNGFMSSRAGRFYSDMGIGCGWWPGFNWAQSSVARISGAGEVDMYHPASYEAFLRSCAVGNYPLLFSGADRGQKTAEVIPIAGFSNAPTDWAANPGAPAANQTQFARGFGGKGVTVVNGQQGMNNFLFGGDGRTMLYGGNHDDALVGGRGGGVIRSGPGKNSITIGGGQNRLYAGNGWNTITMYYGATDLVLDPAGHHFIFGFDPRKGDRISFRRAFANSGAMGAAASLPASGAAPSGPAIANLRLALPGGGEAIFFEGAPLRDTLPGYNLDLTDGWYAAGWTEPVDYQESEFSLPFVPPTDPEFAVSGFLDRGGLPLALLDRLGQNIRFQFKSGVA